MSHSCGWPAIRLTTPVMKAITVASAMLQSQRRGDIKDDPYRMMFAFTTKKSTNSIMSIPYVSLKNNANLHCLTKIDSSYWMPRTKRNELSFSSEVALDGSSW